MQWSLNAKPQLREQPSDRLQTQLNAEPFRDHSRNNGSRPERIWEFELPRILRRDRLEYPLHRLAIKFSRPTRYGLRSQSMPSASTISCKPTIHRLYADTENASDINCSLTSLNALNRQRP